jgi:hypothetical protein
MMRRGKTTLLAPYPEQLAERAALFPLMKATI